MKIYQYVQFQKESIKNWKQLRNNPHVFLLKTAYNDNLGAADLWLPNYIGAIMLYDIVINNATYTNPIIYFFLNLQ